MLRAFSCFCFAFSLGLVASAEPGGDEKNQLVLVGDQARKAPEIQDFRITHAGDPKQYILVTSVRQENTARYGFKLCQVQEREECQKLGRNDFYEEDKLTELRDYLLHAGRAVFWGETALTAAGLAFVGAAYVRQPVGFIRATSEAALESATRPVSMALRSSSLAVADAAEPSLWVQLAGHIYGKYGKAMVFGFMLHVRSEVMSFLSTSSKLLLSSLSPAEHFRSVRLIDQIRQPRGSVQFKKRDYASFSEYYSSFQFENLNAVARKIEDLLEAI